MEVSGQLHASAALPPAKEPLLHIGFSSLPFADIIVTVLSGWIVSAFRLTVPPHPSSGTT
jgi:hypothetical protein